MPGKAEPATNKGAEFDVQFAVSLEAQGGVSLSVSISRGKVSVLGLGVGQSSDDSKNLISGLKIRPSRSASAGYLSCAFPIGTLDSPAGTRVIRP